MANLSWSNGGPQGLIAKLEAIPERLKVESEVVVREVSEWAAGYQKTLLEQATTPTGERRVRSGTGGFAGRHDTGHMIDEITAETTVSADTITGAWGWTNPEDYFLQQDFGEGRIPAADSLVNSFITAEQVFKRRVDELLKQQGI